MITGYEAGFYREFSQVQKDIAEMRTDLETNLSGIIQGMEHQSDLMLSMERSMLIAAVLPFMGPLDIGVHNRLEMAAQAVDYFLKREMS